MLLALLCRAGTERRKRAGKFQTFSTSKHSNILMCLSVASARVKAEHVFAIVRETSLQWRSAHSVPACITLCLSVVK
jgi:hypothetical protein